MKWIWMIITCFQSLTSKYSHEVFVWPPHNKLRSLTLLYVTMRLFHFLRIFSTGKEWPWLSSSFWTLWKRSDRSRALYTSQHLCMASIRCTMAPWVNSEDVETASIPRTPVDFVDCNTMSTQNISFFNLNITMSTLSRKNSCSFTNTVLQMDNTSWYMI